MSKKVCLSLVLVAAAAACVSPVFAQSQSWSEVLVGNGRFAILNQFNGEAVLDRETGLVWQRAPLAEPITVFPVASRYCIDLNTGNRRGWRLPSIVELQSLTDTSVSNPALTVGHPFLNVDLDRYYWSSTTTSDNPGSVWGLNFAMGRVGRVDRCTSGGCGEPKSPPVAWCVRGGAGPDVQ
jgi:hypothetical protein